MSNIKSFLDDLLLAVVTVLFAAILTGCAAPNQPPTPEDELAACRAVLEEFQNHDSYHVHEYNVYDSDIILNEDSHSDYWKHGEDWLRLQRPLPEDLFASLCKDGVTFENVGNSSEHNITWYENPNVFHMPLWLHTCDWEKLDIAYVSTGYLDGAKQITLEVRTPVEDCGRRAERLTMEFHFDKKGNLESIVTDGRYFAEYSDENGDGIRSVYTILSTDPEEIAAKIDGEYQKALAVELNNG